MDRKVKNSNFYLEKYVQLNKGTNSSREKNIPFDT